MSKPDDPREHMEALHSLATGDKLHYVKCSDCRHWSGKCGQGRTVTLLDRRIHLCGVYEVKR